MSAPSAVRPVKSRTLGSGTRLREEYSLGPFYYGFQFIAWAWKWKSRSALAILFLWMWLKTGNFFAATGVTGGTVGASVYIYWLRLRRQFGNLSLRDTLRLLQRKRTLLTQWQVACESIRLRRVPYLRSIRPTESGGFTAYIKCGKIGVPTAEVMKHAGHIADVIGCREVVVLPAKPGEAKLEFCWTDSVGRHLSLAGLPVSAPGQLSYGIRPDGSAATIFSHMSVLIGGLTRHGKSNICWALLADAVRQRLPIRLYVSDPKGGVELDALEAHVGDPQGLLEVRKYAATPAATVKMIGELEEAMRCRQESMKQRGIRKHTPTVDDPLVVLLLDETLPLTDLLKKGTDSPLGRIAYTGGAAGYVVWANTQVAQIDSIGRFRDLIPQRICLATNSPQVTDAVLGQGSESAGAACSDILVPGVGYSFSDGVKRPAKFRAAEVTDAETLLIAAGRVPAAMPMVEDGKATALYRYYAADNTLLYVGMTGRVEKRDGQHADSKPWAHEIARSEVMWFPSRQMAEKAEREAIQAEHPVHNEAHAVGSQWWRQAWQLSQRRTAA